MTKETAKESMFGLEEAITSELLLKIWGMVLERCIGKKIRTTKVNGSKDFKLDRARFIKMALWSKKGHMRMVN